MTDWEQPHWSGRPQQRDNGRPRLRPNLFAKLARVCARHRITVIAGFLIAALMAYGYAAATLSIDADALPEVTLDEKTANSEAELEKQFPNLDQTIFAIVIGADSNAARAQAERLAAALEGRPDLFASAFVPGTGGFYEKFGFLFLDKDEIAARVAMAHQSQPLYQAMGAAPDLQGLAALVTEIGRAVEQGRSPPGLESLLRAVSGVMEAELAGVSQPLDWPALAGLAADPSSQRWFVIATPMPGLERTAAKFAREVSADLTDVTWLWPRRALGREANPVRDFVVPAGLAALIALTLLVAGLGSVRHAVPVVLAALVTTALASAVAALLAPQLDGATWSFAAAVLAPALMLSIMLVLAHVQARLRGASVEQAIMLASQRRGGLQAIFAMIFMAYWLSWLLRRIPSLGEFASIALLGTLIAFIASVTLVPAALAAFDSDDVPVEKHWLDVAVSAAETTHGRNALQVAGMLVFAAGVFCAVFLPGIRLGERLAPIEPPPLLDTPDSRGAVHILSAPGEAARSVVDGLSRIPEVGAIRWIEQFLPLDADIKITTLRQLEGLLPGLPSPRPPVEQPDISVLFADLEIGLRQIADSAAADGELREAAHRLRRAVSLFGNPELPSQGRVLALEDALFSGLAGLSQTAEQLAKLQVPRLEDLDPALRRRFVTDEGLWRIEVMPKAGVGTLSFAAAIRKVAPDAAGEPVLSLSRNEIMHREAGLAFAGAVTASVVLAFAALRQPLPWLLILPAAAFFFTLASGMAAVMGLALNSAMLAAVSTLAALSVSSAVVIAGWARITSAPSHGAQDSTIRAAILPVLVLAGTVMPLAISTNQPVAELGLMMTAFLIMVAALNAVIVPAMATWLRQVLDR